MKKILIPTDFSPNAHHAFLYGMAMAKVINANVKVIHFYRPGREDYRSIPTTEGLDTLVKQKEEKLRAFVQQDYGHPKIESVIEKAMVDVEVKVGFAEEELVKLSKTEAVDLIVMGSTGEGDVIRKIFGSVSSAVSQKAFCPVLLIPPGAVFRGINQLLYASNYEATNVYALNKIIDFAKLFEANIHLAHVQEKDKGGDFQFEELILERLIEKNVKGKIDLEVETIKSETVWEGLYKKAVDCEAEMMVLVTRHRSFWENLWHKSQTREMIRNSDLPLLILHVNEEEKYLM